MAKMEIELTDEQMEKVEILKSKGVDIGEAIDLLFGLQNEIIGQFEEQKQEKNLMEKITDSTFDSKIKAELLKKNYDEDKSYDLSVLDAKHKVKWSEFFKL